MNDKLAGAMSSQQGLPIFFLDLDLNDLLSRRLPYPIRKVEGSQRTLTILRV